MEPLHDNRLPEPGSVDPADTYRYSQVFWHQVGTSQDADVLIFDRPEDPDLNFVPIVTTDGEYLVLHAWRGLSGRHQVYVRALNGRGDFTPLFRHAYARFVFLGNDGARFYFHTNAAAPRGRVIGIDLARPNEVHWVEVIPEQQDPIVRAYRFDGLTAIITVRHSQHGISIFAPEGRSGLALELPGPGTVTDVEFDAMSSHLLVEFESFLRPRGKLRFDVRTGGTPRGRSAIGRLRSVALRH